METKWTVIVLVERNKGQKKSREPNLAKCFPGWQCPQLEEVIRNCAAGASPPSWRCDGWHSSSCCADPDHTTISFQNPNSALMWRIAWSAAPVKRGESHSLNPQFRGCGWQHCKKGEKPQFAAWKRASMSLFYSHQLEYIHKNVYYVALKKSPCSMRTMWTT